MNCDHGKTDGQCAVPGCKFNPRRTLDELIAFYDPSNFQKGAKISVPYGETRRALLRLKELSEMWESDSGALVSNANLQRWRTLEANVENLLTTMTTVEPVRVREGGGPEDLAMSLAVTVVKLEQEVRRVRDLINTPHIDDFLEAVKLEAAHQVERWGVEHDAGKTDEDWFWLIGYLGGKALHAAKQPPDAVSTATNPFTPIVTKQLHHIITIAAACLNWHRNKMGLDTRMRPGIEPPKE